MVGRGQEAQRTELTERAGEPSEAPDFMACTVLVVNASSSRAVPEIVADLERQTRWRAERNATVIWELEGSAHADLHNGNGLRLLADGAPLERGFSYWVAPGQRVWFEGRRPRVAARLPSDGHSIDHLLLTLAEGWGGRSVAVFALPLEEDGQCGLRIIRAVGGLARQHRAPPSTASAPPSERSHARPVVLPSPPDHTAPKPSAPEAARAGRAAPLRMARTLALSPSLLRRLDSGCAAADKFARDGGRERLRVWLPGCRAGGTLYATAMALFEVAARAAAPLPFTIFGTDDDDEALAVARIGRYSASAALGMDPELRGRYTFDEGDTIRVAESLRQVCIFSRQTLMVDPPLACMDLVVCHRVVDRIAPSRRAELAEALHYALRRGGLLLALDHPEVFPEHLFEPIDKGLFRVHPAPAQPSVHTFFDQALERESAARPSGVSTQASVAPPSRAALARHDLDIPYVLCDAALRVSFVSPRALRSFRLHFAPPGVELAALTARLADGVELLTAVRRAVELQSSEELSIRVGRRTYLARIRPASAARDDGVSIVFTDVTQLAEAKAQALAQRLQQAAIARIGELASKATDLKLLYEEVLGALFANVPACSAGLIVELAARPAQFEVVASRGLGADPLRTLRGMGDGGALLNAVVERGCAVTQGGALAAWGASASPREARSARARQALATLQAGMACPVSSDGELLGAIALYGRQPTIDDGEHQHFAQALANVLGGAITRHRTRRRIALELEVSRLLAGSADLRAMGEGLPRALGSVLDVQVAELWSVVDPAEQRWQRLLPPVQGASPERPWPQNLVASAPSGAIFGTEATEGTELLVAVKARELPLCILRIKGAGFGALDRELAEGLRRIAGMFADFLERLHILDVARRNEASYRQKSAELEALYASLPVGVSIHDGQGAIRHVNRHLTELEGGAAGASPLARLYSEEVPGWIARVLTLGEPIHDVELFAEAEGKRQTWLCNFAPIRDGEGRVQGASVVVHEITALKRVEASLREADQEKDAFLAMLGHELRNPMAAIRHATELLSQIERPTPQLSRLQSIFDRQTLQTTKLIDGLLDVARVARGKVELGLAPVRVVELVRQVVDDRRQQFNDRTLDLQLCGDDLWVRADRVRMVQILDNLISNALKFTGDRGSIRIEVRARGSFGSIEVADDGAGIEPELLPEIFEPFRQGRVKTSQASGLGLGLALVKGLVELHGFELAAHSDGLGRGASFRIDFPLASAPETLPPPSRIETRPLDLLLVEDNLDIAETLAELLAGVGHRVALSASAEQALEQLRRERPDVVLCDIGLPGMDGLELAAQLRADPELSDLKLVAMTGFGDASTRARIEAAGFDRYLIKPVRLDALRHCLARIAAPSSLRRGRA